MIIMHVYQPECPCELNSDYIFNIFLPFTLFFEKTSKLNDRPNPYVVKTQKFLLSY